MPDLNFTLHDKQLEIFNHPARFKVVAAGRRGGKSFLSTVELIIEALKDKNEKGYNLKSKEVFYVAPTFQQGKKIMWRMIKDLGEDVIEGTLENTGVIKLLNGRTITICGSDRPDTLRGVGLSYVVLDEYADMKPEVWDLIIRPALSDVEGGAMFIGTPDGKNHFYDLWCFAGKMQEEGSKEWAAFHFNSMDNPHVKNSEIEMARQSMSAQAFRQEYEASFSAGGGGSFKEEHILYSDEPQEQGDTYIAVDLAGFGTNEGMVKSAVAKMDETSIAVVEVNTKGWFIKDVIHGRWDVRETAMRIIKAAKDYRPINLGIESGSLKNAVMPYLDDQMRRMNIYPVVTPLGHGGKKKTERIMWALQGRMEHGRLVLRKADWNRAFVDQLLDFPNPMAHDDLIDSVAYIDQLATTNYSSFVDVEEYEPLDEWSGI